MLLLLSIFRRHPTLDLVFLGTVAAYGHRGTLCDQGGRDHCKLRQNGAFGGSVSLVGGGADRAHSSAVKKKRGIDGHSICMQTEGKEGKYGRRDGETRWRDDVRIGGYSKRTTESRNQLQGTEARRC